MRLHAALPRFRGDCSLSTLVYRIATRVVIDHWRGRPARMTPDLDFESEIAPGLSPAEHADRREAIGRAVTLLNKLKPKLRVAFVLREVMDLPHDEVARIVEAHPAAARMRVALAKRALAALVDAARYDLALIALAAGERAKARTLLDEIILHGRDGAVRTAAETLRAKRF